MTKTIVEKYLKPCADVEEQSAVASFIVEIGLIQTERISEPIRALAIVSGCIAVIVEVCFRFLLNKLRSFSNLWQQIERSLLNHLRIV